MTLNPSIIVEEKYGWKHSESFGLEYWYKGSKKAAEALAGFCHANPNANVDDFKGFLYNSIGHFAFIAQFNKRILAVVDKIRSCPVFYYFEKANFHVSNSGRALKQRLSLEEIDKTSLLEYGMSGYVSGPNTLFRHLYQLQAGELLVWDISEALLKTKRYYLYFSEKNRVDDERALIEELDEVTDRMFRRIVRETDGAPIWVPLSAGLDSRLVLSKLKKLGCDRLHAFSYGPPGNHEAKWAKVVAEKVGVKWDFIPYRTRDIRRFFNSKIRKEYWKMGGEFSSLPFMVDEYAIWNLKKTGKINDKCFIINGQSGDFITGGHSYGYHLHLEPNDKRLYKFNKVFEGIIKKHFYLDYDLLTKNNRQVIVNKILSLLSPENSDLYEVEYITKYYDWWEWQERQSKYVVNGQRSYDFFGIRWALPLWTDEYLLFWQSVPYRFKHRQRLYKTFLSKMDYYGAFREFQPVVWNWQGSSMAVIPVGSLLRRLFGEGVSKRFYRYFSYFGKYQNHYAPFGFIKWLKRAHRIKSPFVFYIEKFFEENRIKRYY